MENYGCYIIKNSFFDKFNDIYLKGNKNENRPHYCCFSDTENDGLYWLIPMSHQIGKYENIIRIRKNLHKPCDILHILKIGGNKSALLIQDMFPITENYIERAYTINSVPLIIKSKKDIEIIARKSRNIYRLIHRNVKLNPTQPNVLQIKNKLLAELYEQKLQTV